MPKKSRFKRFVSWLSTLFRAFGALFYPPNIKNAFKNVTKNWKEYICFYLAALAMSAGFWVIALCSEANLAEAHKRVTDAYDYHVEVAFLDNEQYANLDNYLAYEISRENEYLERYEWANEGKPYPDGTYSVYLTLTETYGLDYAYDEVHFEILNRVSQGRRDIRFTPLYTFDKDFGTPYNVQFWAMSGAWLVFSVIMMLVLFLIRLDHFRFIYGVYMTCGADFPKLIGAAGGELTTILLLTWAPAALIGGGIAAALYIPSGVGLHITARAVLTALLGGILAVFVSVWFPMRRMSKKPPIAHLAGGDNTGLVSSPRRSFYLFGEGFPGKYELYGFWRMRKYYLRLVISAVFFAAIFVSGLYITDMVTYRNSLTHGEYLITYRPDAYYDAVSPDEEAETDEESPPVWTPDAEEADMIWTDLELFYDEASAIDGVSHLSWDVSTSGGIALSHLLLSPGQLYNASAYTVGSEERASQGYNWATNRYQYTAIDRMWVDNMVQNELCTFDGDPYAALEKERHLIISEDIFNDRAFDFKPGDKVMVAVCVKAVPLELVMDEKLLLRMQIDEFTFRYEEYTVAAVMRGADSEDLITLGIPADGYRVLTGNDPIRTTLTVHMENGASLDTVRAADGALRRILAPLSDWTVVPTGVFFDEQVRSLKNDDAVILTLAVCLLIISPLVWYFSQIMFYRKRRREFAVLRALGAPQEAFGRMHRMAGGVLSGAAFLITVLLSLLCNWGVYTVVNTLLPKLGLIQSVHYEFGLSLPALIACVLASVLCGFLSCEVPYRLFTARDLDEDHIEL